jgi:hypothetical protein
MNAALLLYAAFYHTSLQPGGNLCELAGDRKDRVVAVLYFTALPSLVTMPCMANDHPQ